ncbi:hypothetical protein RHECNPAF_2190046 [Rhizobium etli CNPAF512]|nr:hypothetical protein RHECNPAF_2190046 [Rhizobium etli CNPAF512]
MSSSPQCRSGNPRQVIRGPNSPGNKLFQACQRRRLTIAGTERRMNDP